jgi:hypothetical protein
MEQYRNAWPFLEQQTFQYVQISYKTKKSQVGESVDQASLGNLIQWQKLNQYI